MSAVATAYAAPLADAVPVPVEEHHSSIQQMHDTEMKRWMLWFGLPALVGSFFVGMTFATDHAWWLGLAIAALMVDIFVLVWLAMSSDTNGVIDDPSVPSSAH
jgi:hypothetical protein